MGRLLAALALVSSGCAPPQAVAPAAPPAAPQCPEPRVLHVPEPTARAPAPTPDPPPAPEADLEWGFIEAEDLRPRAFGELRITVAPFELEASDGSLALLSRVSIADPDGTFATFEHPVDTGFCGSELTTNVEVIGVRSHARTLFDAQVTCSVGESHPRWNTSHTVFEVREHDRTATLLTAVQAGSWIVVEESQDVRDLRFFLEAGTLAVYEERSAWCDAEAVFAAHGVRERGCNLSARTLTLEQRIALD